MVPEKIWLMSDYYNLHNSTHAIPFLLLRLQHLDQDWRLETPTLV